MALGQDCMMNEISFKPRRSVYVHYLWCQPRNYAGTHTAPEIWTKTCYSVLMNVFYINIRRQVSHRYVVFFQIYFSTISDCATATATATDTDTDIGTCDPYSPWKVMLRLGYLCWQLEHPVIPGHFQSEEIEVFHNRTLDLRSARSGFRILRRKV